MDEFDLPVDATKCTLPAVDWIHQQDMASMTMNLKLSFITVVLLITSSRTVHAEIPFVISYYDNGFKSVRVDDVGYSNLAACGMNVVNTSLGAPGYDEPGFNPANPKGNNLDLAAKYGMMSMVDFHPTHGTLPIPTDPSDPLYDELYIDIDARVLELTNKYGDHPALLGYRLRDEPSADEFAQIGSIHQKLLDAQQAIHGNTDILPWVNLLPNYSPSAYGTGITSHKQYMDAFMTTVQPKVLCYDDYTAANNTTYPANVYDPYYEYSNLERFREYGLEYELPVWRIIESNLGDSIKPPPSPNTEGIYRYQTYTSLAYGFTGILYFTYTQQDGTKALAYYKHQDGEWGTPTANGRYAIAQELNHEVMTLAPVLSGLTSWSVHHTDCNAANMRAPSFVPAEDVETFRGLCNFYVSSISGGEMVYGNFVDDAGKTYILFVNKDYVNAHDFGIQLKYESSPLYNGVARVDKHTGKLVLVETPGDILSLPLEAGDGELFKILYDTTAASVPEDLDGAALSDSEVDLDWSGSYDIETGIDYYCVCRDGVEIGTSSSASYLDTGLAPDTLYQYTVAAVNGEGLESARSLPFLVSTLLTSLEGDLDADGYVGAADLDIVRAHWGQTVAPGSAIDGDPSSDGQVGSADLDIVRSNWGSGTLPGPGAVPEPSTLVVLSAFAGLLPCRRR